MKDEVRRYLAEIGRRGGAAGRGEAKARTTEQARAAVLKRWERERAKGKGKNPKQTGRG